ncbi:HepT-like ribonuclease domain-containing protein [Caloranaerobacter sp. DY30410]
MLVHDYLDVDLDIVYEVIDKDLIDLEKIIKEFAKLL